MKDLIRSIPDFPKKGILFRDITTLLKSGDAFREVIETLAGRYRDRQVDAVVAIEARGFIIGGALACNLGVGFVPVRKKGKLPAQTYRAEYELEYGTDTLEIHKDSVDPGSSVLIVDDLLATGGTASAVISLCGRLEAKIVELSFIIELTDLRGREKLGGHPVFSLLKY